MVLDRFGKRGFALLEVPVKITQESFLLFRNRSRLQREPLTGIHTGFTLVELLLVIGILGILTAATVVILNPAELLAQARDASRASDIRALKIGLQAYFIEHSGSSMGTPGVSYISIPDSSAACANLSLPNGSYRCATSENYRKADSNGWIPLDFTAITTALSVLPVDPVNSGNSYYSYTVDGQGFTLSAHPESDKYAAESEGFVAVGGPTTKLTGGNFPEGWVYVPRNSDFGTAGFWVMKYEAKCVAGTTPLTTPDSGSHTYNNTVQPCTGNYYIASTSGGYPIANISHNNAKAYCEAIGAHLLTNDEYMTIATDASLVDSNWSDNSVGSDYLPRGNSNALAAQDGSSLYGTGYNDFTHLRTLTLSNSSVIYDLAGNVHEHVQRSENNAGDLMTAMTLPACSDGAAAIGYCDFVTASPYISAWSSAVVKEKVAPPNNTWYANHGMGRVYTYKNGTSMGTTVFLRGGYWSTSTDAGAFSLSLVWGTAESASHTVGFRCSR